MRRKGMFKKFSIGFSAVMLLSTTVMADSYYWVSGNSMNPTLEDGDIVKTVSKDYKDGDLVVARTNSGKTIVKRLQGENLVGDGENTVNYRKDEVTILGKAEEIENKSSINVVNATKVLAEEGINSPIDKAYAGAEYVLFLHQNTALSGFGSNVNNTLGMTGGEAKNTSKLTKIADISGFTKIKTRRARAYGFRPTETEGFYDVIRFDDKVSTATATKAINLPVRDYDHSSREEPGVNHHDGQGYITADKTVLASGSDYSISLGIGRKHPYERYNYGLWREVLAEGGDSRSLHTGSTWLLSNEDNTETTKVLTTPTFTTPNNQFVIDFKFREPVGNYDDLISKLEVLNASDQVVFTKNNIWSVTGTDYNYPSSQRNLAVHAPAGEYKIRITTNKTKWDIAVNDRNWFTNAERIVWGSSWNGRYSIVDSNSNVYVHTSGAGVVSRVNIPDEVVLNFDSVVGGDGYHFAAIDNTGKVWTWYTNTATQVAFPNVDGQPFYDNHIIKEVAVGYDFTMAISENKNTGETNVWVWGANDFGKLGLGTSGGSVSTPTKIQRNGVALNNIQAIAAGQQFSVIVQNTPEGQLVWTAGRNNKGQLGGNITLEVHQPQLVPGLKDIDHIFAKNTTSYALDHETKTIYSFGGNRSYVDRMIFNSTMGYPLKLAQAASDYPNYYFINERGEAWNADSFAGAGGYGQPVIFTGTVYNADLSSSATDYRTMFNNGNTNLKNVKDHLNGLRWGMYIGEDGRLWGAISTYATSRVGLGHLYNFQGEDDHLSAPGAYQVRPSKLDYQTYAPAIFEKLVGTHNDGYSLAVDNQGKLWRATHYVAPVNGTLRNSYTIDLERVFSGNNAFYLGDTQGGLWVMGSGAYGKLGMGNSNSYTSEPVRLDPTFFDNKKIVHVSSGTSHTLFVTEDGSVYASGDNTYGKLGDGTINNTNKPIKIESLSHIKKVYAAATYSLALDDEGRVWAWGYNANGSLGNNFSLTRSTTATAVGNETPTMRVLTDLGNYYLSRNGNKEFSLEGDVTEPDKEKTTITASVLGVEKKAELLNDSWNLGIYDEVLPQNWKMTWNIDEISNEMTFQSVTKVVAEDERGGLLEQFFAGRIIVDNVIPTTPGWGETCFLDVNTRIETTCSTEPVFAAGGKNGVNNPVRIYLNVTQKSGENKAPVRAQISYRKKTTAGFYLNDWSEWTEVKKNENNEFYYDFYEGFLGETQIKVRGIDEANNITTANDSSRYVIINNAGGEIKSAEAKAYSDANYALYNQLTFVGSTPSGSAIQSYNVDRRDKLNAEKNLVDEEGNPINHWLNLTSQRVSWDGLETVFTDNNLIEELKGNTTYEYRIDAKNNISIGQPKIVEVITNPYVPENLAKAPDDTGMVLSISQDKRNQGKILYRLVITDNMTGNIFTKDYSSSNVNEDIVYDLRGDEVFTQSGAKIVNNSIKIQVLVQGLNKQWVEVLYEENFINSPAISTDTQKPDVMFMIPELYKTIVNGKYGVDNKIQLSLFATDNVSPRHKLQVQFSLDGTNWIGLKQVSPTQKEWVANHWSGYQDLYDNFTLGQTSGKKIIYVRVQDEAGNVTYANTEMVITDPLNRTNPGTGTTTPINDPTNGTVITDFTNTTERHIKSPNTKITVPKDGNLTEVQFSFNGVSWSPWEKIGDNGLTKYITLPYGNGNRTIMVRYRNDSGLITDVESNSDIITYVLDEEKPVGEIKTMNGTLLSTKFAVPLKFFAEDNLSSQVKVSLVGQNENGQPFTLHKVYVNAQGQVDVNTNADGFINGNKVVLDTGTPFVYGIAGLVANKFNEVQFKLEDKAGNVSYKTIKIFYKQ